MISLICSLLERISARLERRICPNCNSTIPTYNFMSRRQMVTETVKAGIFTKYIKTDTVPYIVMNAKCPYCGHLCIIRKKVKY